MNTNLLTEIVSLTKIYWGCLPQTPRILKKQWCLCVNSYLHSITCCFI